MEKIVEEIIYKEQNTHNPRPYNKALEKMAEKGLAKKIPGPYTTDFLALNVDVSSFYVYPGVVFSMSVISPRYSPPHDYTATLIGDPLKISHANVLINEALKEIV